MYTRKQFETLAPDQRTGIAKSDSCGLCGVVLNHDTTRINQHGNDYLCDSCWGLKESEACNT